MTNSKITNIIEHNPKQLLEWDADVLQYEVDVRQWFDLVAQGEYEVLAHVLQHNGEYVNLVRKVVAHGAVVHQDLVLINTVPHLRMDIAQMLATAKGPFRNDFLNAVQTHFVDRDPKFKASDVLDEALKVRALQNRLHDAVDGASTSPTVSRKM